MLPHLTPLVDTRPPTCVSPPQPPIHGVCQCTAVASCLPLTDKASRSLDTVTQAFNPPSV
eukprot:3064748-Rhodomonas_salina.2